MAAGDVLTREEYEQWVFPMHALALLKDAADVETLVSDIADHLEDGLIRAAAETLKVTGSDQTWQYVELDPRFWLGWSCIADTAFWQTGNRELFRDSEPCRRFQLAPMRMYRVRFDPDGIEKLRPPPMPLQAPTPAQLASAIRSLPSPRADAATAPNTIDLDAMPNKGGRPRAEFWDDLIIDTIRRIYEGDLKPQNQADVVRAMQDWVSAHGFSGGLTQIKPVASKIFKRFT
jgi:hypothetical protein